MDSLIESTSQEIALSGVDVRAYNCESFERDLLARADEALDESDRKERQNATARISELLGLAERTETEEKELISLQKFLANSEADDHKRKIQDVLDSAVGSNAIKEGELTPFEAMGHKQDSSPSYEPSENEADDDDEMSGASTSSYHTSSDEEIVPKPKRSKKKTERRDKSSPRDEFRDDGNDRIFERRIKEWKRARLQAKLEKIEATGADSDSEVEIELSGRLRVPAEIWNKLYNYQKTGVRWLWELHRQAVGGVMGDEMGLGKTVQVIAFLTALANSKLSAKGFGFRGLGPVLVVCPTTIMHQWVQQFHLWSPKFRVAVLHQSGTHKGNRGRLVAKMTTNHSFPRVLVTSYTTLNQEKDTLLKYDWHYVILDEGHKIRNPDAQMTLAAKAFRTPHRLILTGSPMQNSLRELWSLFDFVYPGRLGSLEVFLEQFSVPITQGGYANATQVQVRTAYKCACVLRDLISPYLLRRMKSDVQLTLQLPTKSEQVLFCGLTEHQRDLYKEYLSSRECDRILTGSMDAFVGLILLRKLCNHPDLVTGGPNRLGDLDEASDPSLSAGHWSRSGKMAVVKDLLKLWHGQGHKVLLFSQSRQMLCLMEKFVRRQRYNYLRMDGSTAIGSRQLLVEKFNTDNSVFVFLLTTRVGGLGINLTGADRVIIFDPDWNPSTDTQARERAWRIGQHRAVTIYRLITSGTIEEKIYHRQIFKQFLTNRILKDPRQRRFFKTNDLYELFTLADEQSVKKQGTETSALFAGTGAEIVPNKRKSKSNFFDSRTDRVEPKTASEDQEDADYVPEQLISNERMQQLRNLARQLSSALSGGEQSTERKVKRAHKKPKKNKRTLFDNEVPVQFLDKQSTYRPPDPDEPTAQQQDDYVLGKLFKKSGVHSALCHDNIVHSGSADVSLVEEEADKVAKRATKALTESRRRIRLDRQAEGLPNKKPRFGPRKTVSKPPPAVVKNEEKQLFSGEPLLMIRSKSAPTLVREEQSSSNLLESIRKRKHKELESDSDSEPSTVTQANRYDHLASDLRAFVALKDGKAKTNELLDKFKNAISRRDSAVFRALLRKMCNFERSASTDEGYWVLKDSYR